MVDSILVVCAGNICRSPMAEGILRARCPDKTVSSAGLTAVIGHEADTIAVDLLMSRGIDISMHRARQLVGWQCLRADLILTMDRKQKNTIQSWLPHVRGKVFRIGEFLDIDIDDPYRKGSRAFKYALDRIDVGLNAWLSKMENL
ncbi:MULTISPECIES: low molecular weight protein-tyrosine-phosphatase [Burkholderia cepacia complex]|uniref:low molecular weight protein-tyrosine-phosphatase n=1 Tax=Burkholderia cepacia complex TaxID=87882 RepID=UPI00075AAE60|nr:low molecular weight protein-tyrosine-phosphatase [Burkholderia vietnamiensis]MCA8142916.1 low molecular weight phosphotyrosine protein phosphatase [Burkholderia multivorans]AOJ17616.1 protein tyrosine phosphatase [Burkholderia vietnamiensis]KVE23145.1 protein tyrosine phosphatase [Burkholderia vietnamiensis]KVE63229.1 protein tyrosine phosphatase [Burkholderia vietnamiensis]KVF04120.1 protein tyrosine phosphatase [Burkholderia vietnamiensis]